MSFVIQVINPSHFLNISPPILYPPTWYRASSSYESWGLRFYSLHYVVFQHKKNAKNHTQHYGMAQSLFLTVHKKLCQLSIIVIYMWKNWQTINWMLTRSAYTYCSRPRLKLEAWALITWYCNICSCLRRAPITPYPILFPNPCPLYLSFGQSSKRSHHDIDSIIDLRNDNKLPAPRLPDCKQTAERAQEPQQSVSPCNS